MKKKRSSGVENTSTLQTIRKPYSGLFVGAIQGGLTYDVEKRSWVSMWKKKLSWRLAWKTHFLVLDLTLIF